MLLALVDRHIRALRWNLEPDYPEEEWGFTAQQAVEKLLKIIIVLQDQRPPLTHTLGRLSIEAGVDLDPLLNALQPYAVEARYSAGPFPLPASKETVLEKIDQLRETVKNEIADLDQRDN